METPFCTWQSVITSEPRHWKKGITMIWMSLWRGVIQLEGMKKLTSRANWLRKMVKWSHVNEMHSSFLSSAEIKKKKERSYKIIKDASNRQILGFNTSAKEVRFVCLSAGLQGGRQFSWNSVEGCSIGQWRTKPQGGYTNSSPVWERSNGQAS